MNSVYTTNRKFERAFHGDVKKILHRLGYKDIKESTFEMDTNHATDFVAVKSEDLICIACRIRNDVKYRDLTIRSSTDYNRNKSEWDKVRKGYADVYFYAWSENGKLVDWILVDMNIMRSSGLINLPDGTHENPTPDHIEFKYWNLKRIKEAGALMAWKMEGSR